MFGIHLLHKRQPSLKHKVLEVTLDNWLIKKLTYRADTWVWAGTTIPLPFMSLILYYDVTPETVSPFTRCHEMQHCRQRDELGLFKFSFLYIKDLITKGYFNNRFEVEAYSVEQAAMEHLPDWALG